jgi:hypothetical protein
MLDLEVRTFKELKNYEEFNDSGYDGVSQA